MTLTVRRATRRLEGDRMPEIKRAERLQIMLTQEELTALDDWRFKTRMPSRASAIRELLRRGLAADGFMVAEQGARSDSFGIVAGKANPAVSSRSRRGGAGEVEPES